MGQICWGRIGDRAVATREHVAQIMRQTLDHVDVHFGLVKDYIITGRLCCALNGLVTDHKELNLVRVYNHLIDNGTRGDIVKFVRTVRLRFGEKACMMALDDDKTRQLRLNTKLLSINEDCVRC